MGVAGVQFGVLGPLSVIRDGVTVAVPGARQRTLIALLLAARGVPISRNRLIDGLWGERPPATAVSALHGHLSKLRARLGEVLVFDSVGYSLDASAYQLDVDQFNSLMERAAANAPEHPREAKELIHRALDLVHGEPLCDVVGGPEIELWRRVLSDRLLQGVVLRLDIDLVLGRGGAVIGELEQLVVDHPFEERLWQQLIEALYREGRQAQALGTYERVRRLLASELGLEPGPALAALQQRILTHDRTLGPSNVVPAADLRSGVSLRSGLPRPPTRIIGREREIAALAKLIARRDERLITFVGPGGVGKTRLMLELARSAEGHFADGAVWVELERLRDPQLVLTELAGAISHRPDADAVSPDGLADYLKRCELLIALDNFEHLLPAARQLAELLRSADGAVLLVSSRAPLRLRGERAIIIEPLPLPASSLDADIDRSPAVRMLTERALGAQPGTAATTASARRAAARICETVDGLPLAIELAAARAAVLGIEAVADQLAHPLALGAHALRDLPDRQQTLEAAIGWSYELLSAEARELLATASVFPGDFTRPALEAAAGSAVSAELDELLEASLVRRGEVGGRYDMLALVRAYATERLAASGHAIKTADRQTAYFVAAAQAASERFDAGEAPGVIAATLTPDSANLRIALERSIALGDRSSAVALALGMRPLWLAQMRRLEAQSVIDLLLQGGGVPPAAELLLLRAGSFLDGFQPGPARWAQRLAMRAQELGDHQAYATAINNLVGVATERRDRQELERLRPEMAAALEHAVDPRSQCTMLYCLSLQAYIESRWTAARDYATRAAELAELTDHDYNRAITTAMELLAGSAADGAIRQPELAKTLALIERAGVPPANVFGLWLVARYAAGLREPIAVDWLMAAERVLNATGMSPWPEETLRDETLGLLGLPAVPASADPGEPPLGLADAIAWVAKRDPAEFAVRVAAMLG